MSAIPNPTSIMICTQCGGSGINVLHNFTCLLERGETSD